MTITKDTFDSKAREIIRELRQQGKIFSTSQIRKILELITIVDYRIDYSIEELTEENLYDIKKIYVKLVYQGGRLPEVADLIKKAELFELLDTIQRNKKTKDFKLLVDYLEAIVAWRKLEGGRDQ